MEKILERNNAHLTGEILSELTLNHRTYGEAFYIFILGVLRKSGYRDEIRVMVSERLVWNRGLQEGDLVRLNGQIRTYNQECDGRNKLNIVVFVRELEQITEDRLDENRVFLEGYVCKDPVRRVSPLGREICDIMLAVNRMYNKSDYIPCIAWGRNAVFGGELQVGSRLLIEGRIQSRCYKKREEAGNVIEKTAYEVSILKLEEVPAG